MRRNTALLLAARVASAGTTLIVLALVARLRGPEALGEIGLGFALGAIGAAVSDLGTASLLVREAARRTEETGRFLGGGLAIRLITLPLTIAGVWLAGTAVAPEAAPVITLAAAGVMVQQTAELTRAVFVARQRMAVSSAHAIVENLSWLALVAVALVAGVSLEVTFTLALGVWLGSVAVGLWLAKRLASVGPALPARADLVRIVRLTAPFAAFAIVGIGYSRIDPLLIGLLMSGPVLVTAGSFFAAARLIAAFEYLPEAVSRAIYPELSRRVIAPGATVVPLLGNAAGALLIVGAAVPAVLIPGGSWVMGLLFGEQAARDGWLLGALALAVPIRSLGYIFGVTLTSADAQTRRLIAAASAFLVVVAIDVIGIPLVGLLAPVIATLAAAILLLALYGVFVRRRFGSTGIRPAYVIAAVIAAALAAGAGLVAGTALPEPVAGLIAAMVYVAVLVIGPWGPGLTAAVRGTPAPSDLAHETRPITPRVRPATLVLHASDEAYGADRIVLHVVAALVAQGRRPIVALPADTDPGWLSAELRGLDVPVRRLDLAVARRRYLRPAGLPRYLLSLLKARRAVRRLAEAERADVIHVNTSALLVGGILGHPGGARILWHVHEIVVSPKAFAWLFRLAPTLTADRVIAVSEAVRRHLTPGGRFRRKVVTIHNGLPDRLPVSHPAIPGGHPVVAFVGRLNRWKGHEVFVEAIARIAPRFPDAQFVIAGNAPEGEAAREAALERQIAAAGLGSRVQWLGFVADGASVLEAADIAVAPSTWPDPFPTVVLEGLRAGCAVIASDHGGAPEMIEQEVSGLLVQPGDATRLADAIARLLDEPELRAKLGHAARARFEREFRVERMVADIEAVYRELAP